MDTTGLIVVAAVLVLGTAAGWWRRRTDGRLRSVAAVPAAASGPAGAGPAHGVAGLAPGAGMIGQGTLVMPNAAGWDAGAGAEGASTGGAATGKGRPEAPPAGADSAGAGSDGAGSDGGQTFGAGRDTAATGRAVAGVAPTGPEVGQETGPEVGRGETAGSASGDPDPSAAGERIDPALLRALGVQPAQATLLQFSSAFCAPCRAVRRVSSEVVGLLPQVQHVEVDAESHLDAVRALGIWRTPTLLVLDADGRVAKRATGVPGKPQLIAALGDLLPAS
jgi:thiol-disulfide isomerase/thioredoxin